MTTQPQFKFYSQIWDRKKGVKDIYQLLTLDELVKQVNIQLVGKCRKIYQSFLDTNDTEIEKVYKTNKEKLTAIDAHSISSILDKEWISSNILCYDFDKLTKEELTAIIAHVEDKCYFYMISPSGYGIKIFFIFDNITKANFTGVYKAFGDILANALGKDYDKSSNDLVRLCFLTDSIVPCNDFRDFYKADDYYTVSVKSTKQSKPAPIVINNTVVDYSVIDVMFEDVYTTMINNKVVLKDTYQEWTQELLLSIKYIVRGNDELGLKWFIALSKLDKGFKSEEECMKVYKSFNSFKGSSIKYFIQYLSKYGITIKEELLKEVRSNFTFWYEDEKGKLQLITLEIEKLLKNRFFRVNNRAEIYFKDGNILKLAYDFQGEDEHIYYELLELYFDELLIDLGIEEGLRYSIIKLIKDKYSMMEFKKIKLDNKNLNSIYKRDTKNEIYLYTVKGLLTITKDSVKLTEYDNEDIVDESWLIHGTINNVNHFIEYKNVNWREYKSLSFYQKFCEKPEDLKYLMRIIGYTINTHREYNKNFGILFIDGKETEDNNGGGSGKSIVCKNFEFVRKTLSFNKPKYNSFMWSPFNFHNIINLEDMFWGDFSIRNLRCFYDLKLLKEQKGKDAISIEQNFIPRIIASSNYAPDSTDDADIRRWNIFTPSRFFNKGNTVEQYLGFKMFDYTSEEWCYWLSFIIECCKMYLRDDLQSLNKWDYVTEKKNNELEGDKKFIDIKEYVIDIINNNTTVNINEFFIAQSDLTSSIIKLDRITKNVKSFIKSIGAEFGYSVYEEKILSRKSKNYMKTGFSFKK